MISEVLNLARNVSGNGENKISYFRYIFTRYVLNYLKNPKKTRDNLNLLTDVQLYSGKL